MEKFTKSVAVLFSEYTFVFRERKKLLNYSIEK